jgi:hypothetical protein
VGAAVPEGWHAAERIGVSGIYLLLAAWIFFQDRRALPRLLHDGFRTPYARLQQEE